MATPQDQPILGSAQVPNSAGGFAWAVDDWRRLDRFLILGSEGGSYYARSAALTRENAEAVLHCLAEDGPRAVARIVAISEAGRAPRNDPALFALALAAATGDAETRSLALAALPRVARIGTHLFHFMAYVEGLRGWGRGLRRAIGAWYNDKTPDELAHQVIKYRRRDGWSHRDALRLSHPIPGTSAHAALFHWVTQQSATADQELPALLTAFEAMRRAETSEEVVALLAAHRLPREAVPTRWLDRAEVWEALLAAMPMEAMVRQLAAMARVGLLRPRSEASRLVCERLGDGERLRQARLHPIKLLAALATYRQGHGVRGLGGPWEPDPAIVDALDGAFYQAFGNVAPSGKRIVVAVDVSGSMDAGQIAGVPGLTPRMAASALALVTTATEQDVTVIAFSDRMVPLALSAHQRLDDVMRLSAAIPFGGTDCALPMLWALEHGVEADAFVILTDSETWAGDVHPSEALARYRARTGIPAKLAVVGMVSNGFSIADPADPGMLDVVGFDTAVPQLLSDFIAGWPR
ncbi:TROVE domain-containing protein [bacterium]|nr:TROVE domain-containing protein [bacterium]